MIPQSNADWVKAAFAARLGDPYVYGGCYSADPRQGCDCSYEVGWVLEALTKGPAAMSWAHNVSTESWPYDYNTNTPAAPGTVGPYGTIAAALGDIPADAALTVNIMHGGGGEDSHMNCVLQGEIMESNGSYGSCTNGQGYPSDASLWTDHWYLPGPIVAAPTNTLFYPDVSNNNWTSVDQLIGFLSLLHVQGFAGVCHKVSEGATYQDPYWRVCRDWCEHNNLSWLGYHYVTTDDPAAQADNFTANYGGGNVMLDVEQHSGDIAHFWAVVQAFNNAGVNVSLAYLPHWYWEEIGSPDLSPLAANGISLVSSAYPGGSGSSASDLYSQAGNEGWSPYGGATPSAWQFTDKAVIAGIPVDCNVHLTPEFNLDGFFTGQGI
ncbi:MAG: GH25 family lysozyme [Arthrobacter sp.]